MKRTLFFASVILGALFCSACAANRTVEPSIGYVSFIRRQDEGWMRHKTWYGQDWGVKIEWRGKGSVYVEREFTTTTDAWPIKAYGVQVENGTYTEVVRTGDNTQHTHDRARELLSEAYKKAVKLWNESQAFHSIELVQRLVTPKGLLTSILDRVFDPEAYKEYTEEDRGEVVIRSYKFEVPNDSAQRYTDQELDKLFTRYRTVLDKWQVYTFIEKEKRDNVVQYSTPIKFVRAQVAYYRGRDVDQLKRIELHDHVFEEEGDDVVMGVAMFERITKK